MFLHSGASLHGHEYSSRPSSTNLQTPAHLRTPLLRSAFSPPKQRLRIAADGTPAPALRQRPASDYIPREPSPVVRFREPNDDPPPTPAHDDCISESELSDVTASNDGALSTPAARRRRPRRVSRKSTTYYLGYPAPRIIGKTKVVQKVFLPRLLLQLQRLSEEGRSQPVLEVFPASRIAGPVVAPRLAKRFPGIFGVKRHLGYDDIVLVRRDDSDFSSDGTDSDHEESLERRNLLAVYSPLKHSEEAEIVLDDGSVWVARPLARPLANGSFDFVHTDAEGNVTTARWARRNAPTITPTSLTTDTFTPTAAPQTRYTFSILNPLTRRHPVMATLTPSTLEVQDTYTSVSPSHARHPPVTRAGRSQSVTSSPAVVRTAPYSPSKVSSTGSSSDGDHDSAICMQPSPDFEPSQRTVHQIDNATKMLISVTALWVALRSGWSQSYNSSHPGQEPAPAASTLPASPRNRSRRNTWTTRSSISDHPQPVDPPNASDSSRNCTSIIKRHSMPVPQRPLAESSSIGNIRSPTQSPVVSRTSTPTPMVPAVDSAVKTTPRRATSTGAAFMQRRLQASASFASATSAGVEMEAEGPGSAVVVSMSEEVDVVQAGALVSGQGTGQDAGMGGKKTAAEQAAGVKGPGGKKKKGVRFRLSRWIHKLGSSSR